MWEKLPTGALASAKQTESAAKKSAKTMQAQKHMG